MNASGGKERPVSVILTPLGLDLAHRLGPTALPLAGGPLAFTALEVRLWDGKGVVGRETLAADALLPWVTAQHPELLPLVERRLALLSANAHKVLKSCTAAPASRAAASSTKA